MLSACSYAGSSSDLQEFSRNVRKANWIGHILRRNCLLQQVIEVKIKRQIEVTRRRGRRRKKLLDDLKDRRGYCQLKEEALDRTMWRNILEEALDLSFDRLLMMMMNTKYIHPNGKVERILKERVIPVFSRRVWGEPRETALTRDDSSF